jgi:uncharacterized protein (DUF2147 family)
MRVMRGAALAVVMAVAAGAVAGCAIERAQVAHDAQSKMIGLSKEQVLSCMGVPAARAAEGATEVWSYNSGNDHTTIAGFGQSVTNASAAGGRGFASGPPLLPVVASAYRAGGTAP